MLSSLASAKKFVLSIRLSPPNSKRILKMAINKKLLVCIVLLTITGDELFAQPPATVPPQPVSTANVEYEIGKKQVITRLELNQSTVLDATRLISEVSGINVVASQEAGIV